MLHRRQPDSNRSARDSTDTVTGLLSQSRLDEELASAMADAVARDIPLCVVMFGIDRFDAFNDKWGEASGEQVLRLVARCIGSGTRVQDRTARYGDRTFVAVLSQSNAADARLVAEHIRKTVQSRTLVRKHTGESLGSITISVGIAEHVQGDTPTLILARTQAGLQVGKRANPEHLDAAHGCADGRQGR